MDPWTIGAIYVWACSAGLCALLALPRGRNPALWAALGALFTVFSVVALLALPRSEV